MSMPELLIEEETVVSVHVQRRHEADVRRAQEKAVREYRSRHRHMSISRSLPFFRSGCGTYIHRVKSGHVAFTDGLALYSSFKMWCGQRGSIHVTHDRLRFFGLCKKRVRLSGELLAEPPAGYHLCATCEGRAIGAGMLGEREIRGRKVIFKPRV